MTENIKNILNKPQKKAFYYGETWQNTIEKSEKNSELWFFAQCENYFIKGWRKNRIISVKIPKKLNDYVKNNCSIINLKNKLK